MAVSSSNNNNTPGSTDPYLAHSSIPDGLKQLLADPETPWNLSRALFERAQADCHSSPSKKFGTCEVLRSDPEFNFVMKYVLNSKPNGYAVSKIWAIHHPKHTQEFEASLENMDSQISAFPPNWHNEARRAQRASVHQRWEVLKDQFQPLTIKGLRQSTPLSDKLGVHPLFHGTNPTICDAIATTGFAYFGKHQGSKNASTDIGYFGSGIYFTDSAKYAAMYNPGTLIMAWVGMRPPYPVVSDKTTLSVIPSDMHKLKGLGAYENYNGHFIPVESVNPLTLDYYPSLPRHQPAWDEFVVFERVQTLPRFKIEFAPELTLNPSMVYSSQNALQACQHGSPLFKKWMREDPSRIIEKNDRKETWLHIAAEAGQTEIVSFLLEEGSLLNLTNEEGWNAFHYTAAQGHVEVGKLLLCKKPLFLKSTTKREGAAAHIAASNGQLDFLKWLYEVDRSTLNEAIIDTGWMPLHETLRSGSLETLQWVYEHSIYQLTNKNSNLLHLAAECGNDEATRWLLTQDTSFFSKWRHQTDGERFTPLHSAACHSRPTILLQLLQANASVTAKDKDGYMPIHWVAKRGTTEALAALLKHKSPIDPKGLYGRTPLHMAAFNGRTQVAAMLMENGADVNAQTTEDDQCKTPLHDAANHNDLPMVKLLTSSDKIDVCIRDDRGFTPLFYAVHFGNQELILCILNHSSFMKPASDTDPNSIENLCKCQILENKDATIKLLKEHS